MPHRLKSPLVAPLASLADLDAAMARSFISPIVIFKHSSTCGLSAMAAAEVADMLEGSDIGADVYVVDVHAGRLVSNAIAARLGVRHESPQALIVQSGEIRWHKSHAAIRASSIARALNDLGTSSVARPQRSR